MSTEEGPGYAQVHARLLDYIAAFESGDPELVEQICNGVFRLTVRNQIRQLTQHGLRRRVELDLSDAVVMPGLDALDLDPVNRALRHRATITMNLKFRYEQSGTGRAIEKHRPISPVSVGTSLVRSRAGTLGNQIVGCPKCGTEVTLTDIGNCPNCRTAFRNGEHGWLIAGIDFNITDYGELGPGLFQMLKRGPIGLANAMRSHGDRKTIVNTTDPHFNSFHAFAFAQSVVTAIYTMQPDAERDRFLELVALPHSRDALAALNEEVEPTTVDLLAQHAGVFDFTITPSGQILRVNLKNMHLWRSHLA